MEIISSVISAHSTILIVTLIFILIDIITGIIKALHNGTFNSNKMREGLYHKISYLIIIFISGVMEVASFDPNFKVNFDVPLINAVCLYIMVTDFMSILENLANINPGLQKFLQKYMEQVKNISDNSSTTE